MDDVAPSTPTEQGAVGRLAPEMLAGLGPLARVSRALVGTGSVPDLASRCDRVTREVPVR